MKYIIIGTAGHVDHGKTALVKALTGTDTDRLPAEKERGVSIDLGFANLKISPEITAGVVDVPGHERFLKNMLAGTGGIDLALLVIAADEGVMPQTREHLAMLELYGVKQGITVISKLDKVDPDWLRLVENDIKDTLRGTFLAAAPVCRVSAVTGQGLAELRTVLRTTAASGPGRDTEAPFRMWIDRAFNVKGFGAVVTGSVLAGTIRIGDNLVINPVGRPVKVRGLQNHDQPAAVIYAGQRAAINIAGLELKALKRGMQLSTPGYGAVSNNWDVGLNWRDPVANGTRIRLHIGTAELIGRIHKFNSAGPEIQRVILETPLGTVAGERGILRRYSPPDLLGGVTVIAPSRASRKLSPARIKLVQAVMSNNPAAMLTAVLADAGKPLTLSALRRSAGSIGDNELSGVLDQLTGEAKIVLIDEYYLAAAVLRTLEQKTVNLVAGNSRDNPAERGRPKEVIRQQLGLGERAFDCLLAYWIKKELLAAREGRVGLPGDLNKHETWRQQLVTAAGEALREAGLADITAGYIGEKFKLPPEKSKSVLDELLRAKVVIRVGERCVYSKTIQYIAGLIHEHFQKNEVITVAQFRDLLNTSRKVALPLLEYFDMHKYTIREGDVRRPGQKIKNLSEKTFF